MAVLEGLVDPLLFGRRNADARVADGDVQIYLMVSFRFELDIDDHFAVFGEFDGIAQ